MKLVNRNDIERWAERFESKGDLPILISRLVRATTPLSTQIDFPSGSTVFVGGWDGIVKCQEERNYVPKGISLWEFGTQNNYKSKANSDYEKRTKDPSEYIINQCTFIFVTIRFWRDKNKWCSEKKADGKWKDVKVYDSSDIEQWLDNANAVSRWFSSYVERYPLDGVQTAEEFWEEWSVGPGRKLQPETVTAGREYEQKLLLDFLKDNPSIKAIKASTKNEAIAFIIATAKLFEYNETERFFSKSLIIDTVANYRGIHINTTTPLNLIPRFEETQPLYAAVSNGHHVLVPLGADDSFNQETITLPTIDRDGQIEGLIKTGLSKDDAEKYSRESGRNITILKKLMGFPENKAKWIKSENIREIIPALLLGRWNEKKKGDKDIIEKISGLNYDEYSKILTRWRDIEESPLLQIGETWRLTSPLDAWINLSPFLLKSDFEKLQECFMIAFQNGNPDVTSDEEADKFSLFFSKEKTFSSWAREGLTQSLILIGYYGEKLKMAELPFPQIWVDRIIHSLLYNAKGELWVSLDHEMPLIAEASPISFLEAVNESLSSDPQPIMDMFIEREGFIIPNSTHTGLLWALEGLAWMPEYLYKTSFILLRLSTLDPGGNLSNRPLNSIIEIFKPWHYQTLSKYEDRMEILKKATLKEPDSGWKLLTKMLPNFHGIAHSTHKLRWRMFEINSNIKYTNREIYDTHSYVVKLLISIFDNSENKFAELMDISTDLDPWDRNTILTFAETIYLKVYQKEFTTWHTIRKILAQNRSHPKAEWAIPEEELKRYIDLYTKLGPTDTLNKYLWLFNESWPELIEGFAYDDNNKDDLRQKKIEALRIEGLEKILSQFGLDKIKEIFTSVKEPWTLGDILARIIDSESDILSVSELLNNEKKLLPFIHSFFYRKSILNSFNWITSLFENLQQIGYSNKALAQIFVPQIQSKELWQYIDSTNKEIQKEYWSFMQPYFYNISQEEKILGINYLVSYKRFFSALNICSHFPDQLPTELLVEVLQKSAVEEADEAVNFRAYEIGQIFESIDKRSDIEHSTMISLEWLFLPILASHGTNRSPKILHDELSNNPDFFIEVLKFVYMPKNKDLIEEDHKETSNEIILRRAEKAYELLKSWKKIPGTNPDGSIDEFHLLKWIETVRALATIADRIEVADIQIGQILAQSPENIPDWPPEVICNIIENINTESLKRNFSSALFNKRGSSTRGPFDGGNIERAHAEYFQKLANKHRVKFPIIADIFSNLAKGYLLDAKRMDEMAERDKLEY